MDLMLAIFRALGVSAPENRQFWLLVAALVPVVVVLAFFILPLAGISTLIERKVAADIQRRVGPMQAGVSGKTAAGLAQMIPPRSWLGRLLLLAAKALAWGLGWLGRLPLVGHLFRREFGELQFVFDGVKLLLKEDLIPAQADRPIFRVAPYLVFAAGTAGLAVIPMSEYLYVADLSIGIFYLAAASSAVVIGLIMAGWASNNKWSLLGGMRSAAQIISYEIPAGFVILTAILISGTMSMKGIALAQAGDFADAYFLNNWNVFHPLGTVLCGVFFLACLAECNRTPFDIPEAESELVSGYHTEYSGMRFAVFFMAEYAEMFIAAAVSTTVFFGGYTTGIGAERWLPALGEQVGLGGRHWLVLLTLTLLQLAKFLLVAYAHVLVMMWVRWTVPRFRVDQMMSLCWKKLIPIAFAGMLLWAAWMLVVRGLTPGAAFVLSGLRALYTVLLIGATIWFFFIHRPRRLPLGAATAAGD